MTILSQTLSTIREIYSLLHLHQDVEYTDYSGSRYFLLPSIFDVTGRSHSLSNAHIPLSHHSHQARFRSFLGEIGLFPYKIII